MTEEEKEELRRKCSKKEKEKEPSFVGNHIVNGDRIFNGSREDKKEFLLKVINREVEDRFGLPVDVNTMLRAFEKFDEIDVREDENERNKGSVINIVLKKENTEWNDKFLEEIDENRKK